MRINIIENGVCDQGARDNLSPPPPPGPGKILPKYPLPNLKF